MDSKNSDVIQIFAQVGKLRSSDIFVFFFISRTAKKLTKAQKTKECVHVSVVPKHWIPLFQGILEHASKENAKQGFSNLALALDVATCPPSLKGFFY